MPFLERRLEPTASQAARLAIKAVCVVLGLSVASVLFLPFGADPVQAYSVILRGSFGDVQGFAFTLVKAAPLILIALGAAVAWRAGFFYIGFEGGLYVGALAAVWLALLAAPEQPLGNLPGWVLFVVLSVASMLAGALWAGIVGIMRAKFGGNELLVSLMMNFVAVLLIDYMVSGPLRAPGLLPQTAHIPDQAVLPLIIPGTRAHVGILVAVVAAAILWVVLRKTPVGYELILMGLNPRAARFGGVDVARRVMLAALVAGSLSGLAGVIQITGVQYRLLSGIATGVGFSGVVVALLGELHPVGVVIASILYGGLNVGADVMQREMRVPSSVGFIIQALIVLLILASDVLLYYRVRWRALFRAGRRSDAIALGPVTAARVDEPSRVGTQEAAEEV